VWHNLLLALALLLVIEGIFPFLNPAGLKKTMLLLAQVDEKQLRVSGLISMIIGVILLYFVNR